MGNCLLTLTSSRSFLSHASACSSRSRFSFSSSKSSSFSLSSASMGTTSTPSTVVAPNSKLDRTKILPFPTLSDLGAHYKLGRELGRGQFGIIRLCTCRATGTQFACKSISKVSADDRQLHDILREVHIMQRLSGAASAGEADDRDINIVRLYSVFEDATHVHLIMELCYGGELFDHIMKKKNYPESQAASIMKSLMTSVQFCHRMGVLHRDLKPENILLLSDSDYSQIKLADFGLALEFSPGERFSGAAGSAYYIAPEILKEQEILDAIREGKLEFKWDPWSSISASAKDLIRRMLCPDVKARLTPSQVVEHPWILRHTKKVAQARHHPLLAPSHKDDTNAAPLPLGNSRYIGDMKEQDTMSTVLEMQKAPSLSSLETCLANDEEENRYLQLSTLTKGSDPTPSRASSPSMTHETDPTRALLITLGAKLNLPVPHDLAQISIMEGGWSCTCLSVSASEQIFAVEFGKKKYIVAFDCVGKKRWKILGQRSCKVVSRPRVQETMHNLPVCF